MNYFENRPNGSKVEELYQYFSLVTNPEKTRLTLCQYIAQQEI